jgi:hypothetical protein
VRFALLTLSLIVASTATAQVADSAQAARVHVRAAAASLRGGDSTLAVSHLARAVAAWPQQGAYRLGLANLAARTGRPDIALAALDTLVRQGSGWSDLDAVATLLVADPVYRVLAQRMRLGTAPLTRSAVLAALPDTMLHPEGVAWDGARQRWLVSSIRQRRVVSVGPGGAVRPFVAAGQDGLDAVFGLAVDSTRGLLWAASSAVPNQEGYTAADNGRAGLFAFDLESGRLRGRVELPAVPGGHLLGDLTIAPDGAVYTSDSRYPAVYRARGLDGTAEILVERDPLFCSLQGLALSEDGRALYLADWSHGLLRVDLATRRVIAVPLTVAGTALGIDGLLRLEGRRLIGIQNGTSPPRVVLLTLDRTGERIVGLEPLDRHLPIATEPTLGVLAGGALVYVANSPWTSYDDDGQPLAGAAWPRPTLLRLPLPAQ